MTFSSRVLLAAGLLPTLLSQNQNAVFAQKLLPRPVGESKPAYALTAVLPPQFDAAGKSVANFRAIGIADDGTIFFRDDKDGIHKRLPGGGLVSILKMHETLSGNKGICRQINSVIVGAGGDLVLELTVAEWQSPPPHPTPIGPPKTSLGLVRPGEVPFRRCLYYLPRDTKEHTTTHQDMVMITALEEPAPGLPGWMEDFKGVQIAADGMVIFGAAVVSSSARCDAYFVYRSATPQKPEVAGGSKEARLVGPIVMTIWKDKPAYTTARFYTLGAPALDAAGDLIFAAEPENPTPASYPEFALYRLPKSAWESVLAGLNAPVFPLPSPTRLLGVRDLTSFETARYIQIDGVPPSVVDSTRQRVYFRVNTVNDRAPRVYEAALDSAKLAIRPVAGGKAPAPDNSEWAAVESSIMLGEDRLVFTGRTRIGEYRGDCIWAWLPGTGFLSVARQDTYIGSDVMRSLETPYGHMINRSGIIVFTYHTQTRVGGTGYGVAAATPL